MPLGWPPQMNRLCQRYAQRMLTVLNVHHAALWPATRHNSKYPMSRISDQDPRRQHSVDLRGQRLYNRHSGYQMSAKPCKGCIAPCSFCPAHAVVGTPDPPRVRHHGTAGPQILGKRMSNVSGNEIPIVCLVLTYGPLLATHTDSCPPIYFKPLKRSIAYSTK